MKTPLAIVLTVIAAAFATSALADGSLRVQTTVQKEQRVTADDGTETVELVAVTTAVPGDQVIYTITFTNEGNESADNVRITNPIPAEMKLVEGSAFGPGAEVTYSVDGGASYADAASLSVATAEGTRLAKAEDYTHIRWAMTDSLSAGDQGFASFRAVLR